MRLRCAPLIFLRRPPKIMRSFPSGRERRRRQACCYGSGPVLDRNPGWLPPNGSWPGTRATPIRLVEDNAGDVRLITETFREGKIHNRLSVVEDGVEAVAFLRREGKYDSALRPDLILLDLSLP